MEIWTQTRKAIESVGSLGAQIHERASAELLAIPWDPPDLSEGEAETLTALLAGVRRRLQEQATTLHAIEEALRTSTSDRVNGLLSRLAEADLEAAGAAEES